MTFIQAIIKNATRSLQRVPKASATVTTQQTLLMWATGLAVEADSSATVATLIGVCNDTYAASDAQTTVAVIDLYPNDVWIMTTTNNSNAAHDGQYMVLTDSTSVNNTGTTNTAGVVQQLGVYGAAANKQILGRFIR